MLDNNTSYKNNKRKLINTIIVIGIVLVVLSLIAFLGPIVYDKFVGSNEESEYIFFYPADFTFVCPTELEDLANKYEEFRNVGCEVYSVSTDTHFVHKAWHDASERIKKINYPMLADPTHAISKDFEVLIESDGLAERGTFIINPEGKIVGYEVTAGNVGRNAEELFRKVQACQFVHAHGDQVCPANWKPGAETLKPSLDLVGQL